MRERALRDRLLDYAASSRFSKERDRAMLDLFGPPGEHPPGGAASILFARYLIQDHRTERGDTILERFVREHSGELSEQDRHLIAGLRQSRWGIFEVLDVKPGRSVAMKDLLTEETLDVRDVSGSRSLVRWQLVFGCIAPGRGAWVGDGALTGFAPEGRKEILEALEELGIHAGRAGAPAELARRIADVNRALTGIAFKPPCERAVTMEGDPVAMCEARYSGPVPYQLVEALEATPELYPAGPDDDGRLVFNWAKPEEDIDSSASQNLEKALCLTTYLVPSSAKAKRQARGRKLVNLATIAVGPEDAVVDAVSEPRLRAARRIVERANPALKLEEETIESVDLPRAWAERLEEPEEREDADDDAITPEEDERMRRKLAAEFVANWPDSPLKLLGGLTPREAVQRGEHCEELVDIMKELEYHASLGQGVLKVKNVKKIVAATGFDRPALREATLRQRA